MEITRLIDGGLTRLFANLITLLTAFIKVHYSFCKETADLQVCRVNVGDLRSRPGQIVERMWVSRHLICMRKR